MNMRVLSIGALVMGVAAAASAEDVAGGLVVCIGADALESVSEDWQKPGRTFHCLETDAATVAALRKKLAAAGCHGKVAVARFDGTRLPYVDNLARTVVAGDGCSVPRDEIMRVLAPFGTAIVGDRKTVKPYPARMDEWPQYLHGADNNCVADDTVVGPPRHVQWVSGPAWTRAHIGAATIASMVSAGGRLFTIEDTATAENPLLPAQWELVARDAFSGIVLWTLPYPDWEQVTVYIKNFHAQMQRRLVASGDTVYCTPGLAAPVTALDAATGSVLRTFAGTKDTQEFVLHNGRLYVVVGDRMRFSSYKGARFGPRGGRKGRKGRNRRKKGDTAPRKNGTAGDTSKLTFGGNGFPLSAYNPQTPNAENPTCAIVAVDAETGKECWRSGAIEKYTGCSMALKGNKLVYQSAGGVFCLDARTGTACWSVTKDIPYGQGNRPNTLVLGEEAVYAEEGKQVFAYALADGSDYWGRSIPARKGYQASTDILIAAGALWMCGNCNNPKGTVKTWPVAYDLKTGEKIKEIRQVLSKPMGHDRCYRNFITTRFYINSKTGGPDCLDLETGTEYPASFTRPTCSMGPLPCNGLIYCGPWSCQCHLPTGLHNFNAFYTDEASLLTKGQVVTVECAPRLEKGPAWGAAAKTGDAPWPTYRQDARRYAGIAETVPAAGLKPAWQAAFDTPLTAPVIADDTVFVAETETYTLRALDAGSGKPRWAYIAGGRIDSPPTYHKGLLLFGTRDGWVHCVRAADGAPCWRFRDLPGKLICAFDRLESAWPVHGSVLVAGDTAYVCAGRSSYLDGGIFIYGLDPATGAVRHRRRFYGPYGEDGFPRFVEKGNRSETEVILGTTTDVMSSEDGTLYIRHQAFTPDLADATPGVHLLASSGMLEAQRNHREYKLVGENFNHRKQWTTAKTPYPTGDLIVADGTDYYSLFGHPVNRGQSWNPRGGYLLNAKTRSGSGWSEKWRVTIPMTGTAMVLAGETLFVGGAPLVFPLDDLGGTYAGRQGGILRAVAAADGSKRAEYTLERLPAWDGMAAADGRLFIVYRDGSIECRAAGR